MSSKETNSIVTQSVSPAHRLACAAAHQLRLPVLTPLGWGDLIVIPEKAI